MKRSTLILGFALLIVAATLATTITVRNDPRHHRPDSSSRVVASKTGQPSNYHATGSNDSRSGLARTSSGARRTRDYLDVSVPGPSLTGRPPEEQTALRQQAASVQRKARQKLERMTEEFALTAMQRRKMFPVLVRSTPGYDSSMQVAGVYLDEAPATTAAGEEMHGLLDSEQREQLEDQEVDRQLWWQDVFTRIERDLLDSTGGVPPAAAGDPDPVPAAPLPDERVTPPSRRGARSPE